MTTDADPRTRLLDRIRDIPDFPKPGIVFKDITPLLADQQAFATAVDLVVDRFVGRGINRVVGIEARGFILAAPVAYRLGAGFVPIRKHGKLPWDTLGADYELEYGNERLEMHSDAVAAGDKVLVVDDVLATGGTAQAAFDVIRRLGAEVAGFGVIIELAFLGGRERIGPDVDLYSIITFD
jgi:adenine phosphoribosyltransferase